MSRFALALYLCLVLGGATLASPEAPLASTPRDAMEAFLDASRAGRYDDAAHYLDLDGAAAGGPIARQLKVVLDRTLWVDLEALSDEPAGDEEDERAPGVDLVGTIASRHGPVDVLLERDEAVATWGVASSTVRRVHALYEEFGYGRLGEVLPELFFTVRFLGMELWQWVGLLLWLGGAWLVGAVVTRVLVWIVQPIVRRTESHIDDRIVLLVLPPARLAVVLGVFAVGTLALKLSVPVDAFLRGLEKGLAIAIFTWVLTRLVDVASEVLAKRVTAEGKTAQISLVSIGRKAVKAVLLAMAAIGLLHYVGFNITGVVAGLGVGGLAVALAAQKTVENLFGGLTLAADQPVRVGDFCRFGTWTGTVEDVGLRSTRVRTLDRTVVTVPNAIFSSMELENFNRRDKIRLFATIGLRYETSGDQLRWALAELRKLLVAHPMVLADPARVRFTGFGASSLDIEIFAYVATSDFNEFLKVKEDLLLRVLAIVEESGTGFAFPSQTVYFGRDTGLDPARTEAAVSAVRGWRERGTMPFPDPAPETVAALEDSLDWPPAGSAVGPAGRRG